MTRDWHLYGPLMLILFACSSIRAADLSEATVVFSDKANARHAKAATMLVDEIEKRTGVRWIIGPAAEQSKITLELDSSIAPEGYRLSVDADESATDVVVAGSDDRGILFGVGRLLERRA